MARRLSFISIEKRKKKKKERRKEEKEKEKESKQAILAGYKSDINTRTKYEYRAPPQRTSS